MKSNYPILRFDTFIKEVTMAKNIRYSEFKTAFDLICFSVSLVLGLIFFGRIEGIHIGTFISALALGSIIGFFLDLMNKHIEGKTIFPEEITKMVMDFDFINRKTAKS